MNTRIIIFLGPVGVGKSTQARLLVDLLKRRSYKVRSASIVTYYPLFLRLLSKLGHKATVVHYNGHREQALSPLITKQIINGVIFLDLFALLVVLFLRILIPIAMIRPRILIVEEYLVGTLINYFEAYLRGFMGRRTFRCARTLLTGLLAFGRKEVIVMNASLDVLKSRWIKRGSPPERLPYIDFQCMMFGKLNELFSGRDHKVEIKYIDATNDMLSVFEKVLEVVHLE